MPYLWKRFQCAQIKAIIAYVKSIYAESFFSRKSHQTRLGGLEKACGRLAFG
jgi:hypothetical protein